MIKTDYDGLPYQVFSVRELIRELEKIEEKDKDKPVWVYSYDDVSPVNMVKVKDEYVLVM